MSDVVVGLAIEKKSNPVHEASRVYAGSGDGCTQGGVM